ncbi:MAG: response regulator [Phycicoccus sp.]
MIRVLLVDDDLRIRRDLECLLDLEPDLAVVGTVGDGREAVVAATRLAPHVIVMDVRMPGLDGISAIARLRAVGVDSHVLVLTTFDVDEYVIRAVRAGAAGFMLKDRAASGLAGAVRALYAGESVVDARATTRLLRALVRPTAVTNPLTERETEVLTHLATGMSNEEIAGTTGISRLTVKTHVSSVLTKLGMTNRVQAAVWAHERGLVSPRPSDATSERTGAIPETQAVRQTPGWPTRGGR